MGVGRLVRDVSSESNFQRSQNPPPSSLTFDATVPEGAGTTIYDPFVKWLRGEYLIARWGPAVRRAVSRNPELRDDPMGLSNLDGPTNLAYLGGRGAADPAVREGRPGRGRLRPREIPVGSRRGAELSRRRARRSLSGKETIALDVGIRDGQLAYFLRRV